MNKHTPGPWSVSELDAKDEPSEYYIFIEPGVAVIERKFSGSNQCDMPDAHLIAASPEMAELLATFTMWARQVAARSDVPQGIRSAAAQLHDDGKRLHAKATREPS